MTPFSALLSLSSSISSAANISNITLMVGAAEYIFTPAMEETADWQPKVYKDVYARPLVLFDCQEYLVIITAGHFFQGFDETEKIARLGIFLFACDSMEL